MRTSDDRDRPTNDSSANTRMVFFAAGVGCFMMAGVLFLLDFMGPGVFRRLQDIAGARAQELIVAGAVDAGKTKEVLGGQGFAFDPDAGEQSGLGAFIVRDEDLESLGTQRSMSLYALMVSACVHWGAAIAWPRSQSAPRASS